MLLSFAVATFKLVIIVTLLIVVAYIRQPNMLLKKLFKNRETNMSYSGRESPRLIRSIYPPGFLTDNSHLCPNKGRNLSVLIAIFSAPSFRMSRNTIRKTWGQYSKRKDVSIIFFVGNTNNHLTRKYIQGEQEYFGDIVQGKFEDSYYNLTLKTLSILEWVKIYCPESPFLLKIDDDVFLHVSNLLKLVSSLDVNARKIYGSVVKKLKPYRDPRIKYFITHNQYRLERFPDFIGGPAYLIPVHLTSELYSSVLQFPYLKVEDVLVTGIISRYLGIKLEHISNFHNQRISMSIHDIREGINVHSVSRNEQFYIWGLIHTESFENTYFKREWSFQNAEID